MPKTRVNRTPVRLAPSLFPLDSPDEAPGQVKSRGSISIEFGAAEEAYPRWPTPVCIVLGNEGAGLHPNVLAACTRRVNIPGSGAVESLNVSVAAGILLAAARASAGVPS